MAVQPTRRDELLLPDLCKERPEHDMLEYTPRCFRRGGMTLEGLLSMLSAFKDVHPRPHGSGKTKPCFLVKILVDPVLPSNTYPKQGEGLEQLRIYMDSDKPVALVLRRKIIAHLDVQHKPRHRHLLVLWLRKH